MSKLRLKALSLAVLFSLLAWPAAAYFDPQYRDLGDRQVAIWWWGKSEQKKPLILFSHGFNGCNDQTGYLGSALAEAGYVFVGVNHRDANCKTTFNPVSTHQQLPEKPELWTQETYADRVEDFRKVLEALKEDKYYGAVIDFQRVGFIGYSLGGYTGLGVAGGWPSWRLPGVKAVMVAAPYVTPYFYNNGFKNIYIPVMFQAGTRDAGVTEPIVRTDGAFQRMISLSYLVNFDGAGHEIWGKQDNGYKNSIISYARAFFDSTLQGMPKDPLLEKLPGVFQLEENSGHLRKPRNPVVTSPPAEAVAPVEEMPPEPEPEELAPQEALPVPPETVLAPDEQIQQPQ
jgi:pimeloyl-ACP methyl ester carboxylesterase